MTVRCSAAVFAAAFAAFTLAACGDGEELDRDDSDLFLRDAPDRAAPLRPAPELEDLPESPEPGNARLSAIEECAETGDASQAQCVCMVDAARQQFGTGQLRYFRARIGGAPDRAGAYLAELPEGEAEATRRDAQRIMMECGAAQ